MIRKEFKEYLVKTFENLSHEDLNEIRKIAYEVESTRKAEKAKAWIKEFNELLKKAPVDVCDGEYWDPITRAFYSEEEKIIILQ